MRSLALAFCEPLLFDVVEAQDAAVYSLLELWLRPQNGAAEHGSPDNVPRLLAFQLLHLSPEVVDRHRIQPRNALTSNYGGNLEGPLHLREHPKVKFLSDIRLHNDVVLEELNHELPEQLV